MSTLGSKYLLALLIAYISVVALLVFYHLYYADKILARIQIGRVDVGGLTIDQAREKLQREYPHNVQFKVSTNKLSKDFDSNQIDFIYNYEHMLKEAYEIGRAKNFVFNLIDRFTLPLKGKFIMPEYSFDSGKLDLILATLKLEGTDKYFEPEFYLQDGKLLVREGKVGDDFDSIAASENVIAKVVDNDTSEYKIAIQTKTPELTVDDLESTRPNVENLLSRDVKLKYNELSWEVSDEEMLGLINVSKKDGASTLDIDDLDLSLKLKIIATEVDRVASGQILDVKDGIVSEFKPSLDGRELQLKDSITAIRNELFKDSTREVVLVVNTVLAPDSDNDYGIKELLATGTSKFEGSIPSRIHNIGVASKKVSGVLVPPGEVFSFVKSVGNIDRNNGYKSAYVISGGRTVLGDGGGVCQVSTTLFRAAINAGFPILERNPHSYRVGYYEQDSEPGLDAAIFVPSADLKFKNDSEHHILVLSTFDEAKRTLRYDIYGTKDGRNVEVSTPKVLSRRAPPATIYEDDPSLPKGKQVRVESPVAGASVEFTRKVTKDGAEILNDVFKSNYRAWPAVYKVGTAE